MAQQTAVDWLHEIAKQREPDKFDWEQAKQMENEFIKNAYNAGYDDAMCNHINDVENYINDLNYLNSK
jgi:anti-sigma regulatory factor (Ser/Thr protein kinase)